MIDPFGEVEQEWEYLTIDEKSVAIYQNQNPNHFWPELSVRVQLSSRKNIYNRQVENIFDVLGDIGGFYDIYFSIGFGLNIFWYLYNVIAFETEISSSMEVDTGILLKSRKFSDEQLSALHERLQLNENTRLKRSELYHLGKQFKRVKKVAMPFFSALCCCRLCFKRTK